MPELDAPLQASVPPPSSWGSAFGRFLRRLFWLSLLTGLCLGGGWYLFARRDRVLLSQPLENDSVVLRVVVQQARFGGARAYLVAEDTRLGESQRLYLRSFDEPRTERDLPRLERITRPTFRVCWPLGLVDEASLSLRVLQGDSGLPSPTGDLRR